MKWTLVAVNSRLKAGKIGCSVRQRGDRLSLRATLPPKPGSDKLVWYQQDISLGIYANPAGLAHAETEAKLLGARLATKKFNWDYYKCEQPYDKTSCAEVVANFKDEYFARKGRTEATQRTWDVDYATSFKLLHEELSTDNLIATIASTPANSRKRKIVCEKLTALALFAGLEIDLHSYKGNYGAQSHKPKNIPSDALIEDYWYKLNGSVWQWVYGAIAAYGLRPHEAFNCEISPNPPYVCCILKGKTGSRISYPLQPNWVTIWRLYEIGVMPKVTDPTFHKCGQRTSKAFARAELGFSPYCLRHAYAIRAACKYKIPIPTAATWMGHSPVVFLKTYNRWISQEEHQRVFLAATSK